jgi:DNA-binding CsgD family transcriptional regulator
MLQIRENTRDENRRFRMAEFLSKEEIKQWRSSLEKITLEEFAARLGKEVAESRPTNDLVDIVFSEKAPAPKSKQETSNKLSKIAERAFERERQLSHTPFSFKAPTESAEPRKETKKEVKPVVQPEAIIKSKPIIEEKSIIPEDSLREEVDIVLKKNLTDREQVVFDYLLEHKNTTVYAKDLAVLLDLPRDYIYKYIKNLRAKIDGDKLKNADRGGFILSV